MVGHAACFSKFLSIFSALFSYPFVTGRSLYFQQFLICLLLDFSLSVKAATLVFISGCSLAISSAKEGKSGFIYNLVKS